MPAAAASFDGLWDGVVIGAGAAGLHAAAIAGARGLRVLLIDHAERRAEKIRISGGGRCNVTNRDVSIANFHGRDPAFARQALARWKPSDFLARMAQHGLSTTEKHKGQLFCDQGSGAVIAMLMHEAAAAGVTHWQPCRVRDVRHEASAEAGPAFALDTDAGPVRARQLVIATGGLALPKLGASDFGLRLAARFGHDIVPPKPALVPLRLIEDERLAWEPLAGVACPARLKLRPAEAAAGAAARPRGATTFDDDLLVTHRGFSGPAVLQVSTPWQPGDAIEADLLPGEDVLARWAADRSRHGARTLAGWLGSGPAAALPQRLVEHRIAAAGLAPSTRLADLTRAQASALATVLQRMTWRPDRDEGWGKAEVMAGGVATAGLDPRRMVSRHLPGLHVIGEAVDITGWLGGYNFQWAWSSAWTCAMALRTGMESLA